MLAVCTQKVCGKCKESKDHTEFYRDLSKKDGRHSICILCVKARKESIKSSDEYISKLSRKLQTYGNAELSKICTECKQDKPLSHFWKDKYGKFCRNSKCISCAKETASKLRATEEFKKAQTIRNSNYRQKNRHVLSAKNKVWRASNKDKTRALAKKKYEKRKGDPMFRQLQSFKSSLFISLKNRNIHKNGTHWESVVGYSLDTLRNHLESQFDTNMTWDNYGTYWHLDHIRPICSFHITSINDEEFKVCWGLANLRPLNKFQNIAKSIEDKKQSINRKLN